MFTQPSSILNCAGSGQTLITKNKMNVSSTKLRHRANTFSQDKYLQHSMRRVALVDHCVFEKLVCCKASAFGSETRNLLGPSGCMRRSHAKDETPGELYGSPSRGFVYVCLKLTGGTCKRELSDDLPLTALVRKRNNYLKCSRQDSTVTGQTSSNMYFFIGRVMGIRRTRHTLGLRGGYWERIPCSQYTSPYDETARGDPADRISVVLEYVKQPALELIVAAAQNFPSYDAHYLGILSEY